MILEFLEYLLTPCGWATRRLGYLRGLMGIKFRHRRCRRAWQPHLDRTRRVIREAMELCPERRKAVVLGSGMLLDVPLRDLTEQFEQVVLGDGVHPLRAYWHRLWQRNVRLLRADVTGVSAELFRAAKTPGSPLPKPTPNLFLDDPEVDLVISLNLLSQLPFVPTTYLARRKTHTNREINAFARELLHSHLEYLQRLPGVVALITDSERIKYDQDGNEVERLDILYGVKFPYVGQEWTWELAPLREVDASFAYHRRVHAVPNVKTAELA